MLILKHVGHKIKNQDELGRLWSHRLEWGPFDKRWTIPW